MGLRWDRSDAMWTLWISAGLGTVSCFLLSILIRKNADSLLLFQLREIRHGHFHEVPIMLRRHETHETFRLIVSALFGSDSLHHQSYKLAILATAHLTGKQRLPRSWLKVSLVDSSKITSCGEWFTNFYKPWIGSFPLRHAQLAGLRLVGPQV